MTDYPKALYRNGQCLDPHAFDGAHHAESRVVRNATEETAANEAGYWPIGQAPSARHAPIEQKPLAPASETAQELESESAAAPPAPAPAKKRGGRPKKAAA